MFFSVCNVKAKVLDCRLEGSEFEIHPHYYVHFLTPMNPPLPNQLPETFLS